MTNWNVKCRRIFFLLLIKNTVKVNAVLPISNSFALPIFNGYFHTLYCIHSSSLLSLSFSISSSSIFLFLFLFQLNFFFSKNNSNDNNERQLMHNFLYSSSLSSALLGSVRVMLAASVVDGVL